MTDEEKAIESEALAEKILDLFKDHHWSVYLNALSVATFSSIMSSADTEDIRRELIDQFYQALSLSLDTEMGIDRKKWYDELCEKIKQSDLHNMDNLVNV